MVLLWYKTTNQTVKKNCEIVGSFWYDSVFKVDHKIYMKRKYFWVHCVSGNHSVNVKTTKLKRLCQLLLT